MNSKFYHEHTMVGSKRFGTKTTKSIVCNRCLRAQLVSGAANHAPGCIVPIAEAEIAKLRDLFKRANARKREVLSYLEECEGYYDSPNHISSCID